MIYYWKSFACRPVRIDYVDCNWSRPPVLSAPARPRMQDACQLLKLYMLKDYA